MSRKTIKFSHNYPKMPVDYNPSRLIEIFVVDRDKLSDAFVSYDTKYYVWGKERASVEYWTLPKGQLMVLVLLTRSGYIWTTIRRCTANKLGYYEGAIGETFDIEIKEE